MNIIRCTDADAPRLALLNKQLIDDEGSDNPMSPTELEARMRSFLAGDYEAFFFTESGSVVGYALVDVKRNPPYLRQFLIERASRRARLGTAAFKLLEDELECPALDVEVLSGNAAGVAFWQSLGFLERSRYLRLEK